MTRIVVLPDDPALRATLAHWSVREWSRDFPGDTDLTYLDLYRLADEDPAALPTVLVALSGADDRVEPVGTVSVVDDDELPDATEPGPWLAALFVHPDHRRTGIGAALVAAAESEAARLGHTELYLYTADSASWYERLGWQTLRVARLGERPVTVMHRTLSDAARIARQGGGT